MATKFIIAIVGAADSEAVMNALVANHYAVTRVASTGGFLRRGGQTTLLIGVDEAAVSTALDLIRASCQSEPQADEHRATLFVLDTVFFEQI